MTAPSNAVPASHPEAGESWTKVASSVRSVAPGPDASESLASALPLRASPTQKRRSRTVLAGLTATEPSSSRVGIGAPTLGLTEWTTGSSVVVSVTGEVDIATVAQLSQALDIALHRGVKGLVCDLTGVGFLGAAGLTALLVARRRAIAGHTWFDLVCPQPLPRRVIALVGLDAVLSPYDRVADAADVQAQHAGRPGLPAASGAR